MEYKLPPIYFYSNQYDILAKLITDRPDIIDAYHPDLVDGNTELTTCEFCWTLQTYLRLKQSGFSCELTGEIPEEGIILVNRNSLPFDFQPGQKQLLVCMKADKPLRPYAQLHVVQNLHETKVLPNSYYMPHWTQPGLIPRDPARGDRFETIAFFGTGGNLAPELRTSSGWDEKIQKMGLQWRFKGVYEWHDFSDVDCILACRTFDHQNLQRIGMWKPALKLFNSWKAGVLAILGPEYAYREQRRSELDYLEVTSVDSALNAIQRLRDDRELRRAMTENAHLRAQEIEVEKIVEHWRSFLINVAVPAYQRWCSSPEMNRQIFLKRKYLQVKIKGAQNRLFSILNKN